MSKFELLREAVANGDKAKILDVLKEDADLNARDDMGNTLLHVAFTNAELSQVQLTELLEIFLDRGLNINAENNVGKAVLHLAVERRMRDVIDFCLERNADPYFIKNIRCHSIAQFAIEEECRKLNLLIQADAIDNFESEENESSSFIDWMVARGIDFFHTRNKYVSALFMANFFNLQHIVLTLLKHVSDVALIAKARTPLLYAFLKQNATLYGPRPRLDPELPEKIHSTHYKFRHVRNIVKMILEKSKSIDDETLAEALRSANEAHLKMDVIEMLLQRISSVDRHQIDGKSLFQSCADRFGQYHSRRTHPNHCVKENMTVLRALALKGADVNERDANGYPVTHSLFKHYPKLEMLELFKEIGVDFNARAPDGTNFLDLVCWYGDEAGMVDLVLTSSCCDVNAINCQGHAPLQAAIRTQKGAVVRDLIEHGAEVNAVYADSSTPLTIACACGEASTVEILIECGADLDYRDELGRTLLHLATRVKSVVQLLLNHGLDVNAKDMMGKTPLHYAASGVAVKVLVRAGARVDVLDKQGISPLHDSLTRKKSDGVTELLKCGADVQDLRVLKLLDNLFLNYRRIFGLSIDCYLRKYFVKLAAVGLDVKIPCEIRRVNELCRHFFIWCQSEAESLKAFFIDKHTSLYTFLHKNRNRRCAYVNNEKLKKLVEDDAIEQKFFYYSVLILGYYNEAATRKSLMQPAKEAWNKLKDVNLPDLCTDKILMYMSNIDLICFTEACEDVNLDALNER